MADQIGNARSDVPSVDFLLDTREAGTQSERLVQNRAQKRAAGAWGSRKATLIDCAIGTVMTRLSERSIHIINWSFSKRGVGLSVRLKTS